MLNGVRRAGLFAALVAAGLAGAYPAAAQGLWPTQPVKFIVPNPPGGLPDVLSRIVADRLKERLGQTVIVENRPGANAGIGAAAVTASKPDGYTFLVSDSAVVNISHLLNAQLPFNPKDLVPMVLIARAPIFLGANTELPVKSFSELIEHAKANPGKINYGSIGVGSFHHLSMEAVQSGLGIKLNHIPYKGSGESVTALRAGQISLVFASFAGLSPAIKSNQARLLAVNSLKRSSQAPDVPAISETIPGFDLPVTQSLYARVGTPVAIAERIAKDMAEVVKEQAIVERFAAMGIEAAVAGPAEVQRVIKAEGESILKIVTAAGLKPQ
jgi:tripartite-type tricarboxylate transporter receptor subunit TctC